MTTKPKATVEETVAEPAAVEAPQCRKPHNLAVLAHVLCQEPAGHDDPQASDQGERRHRARYQGTLYVWE